MGELLTGPELTRVRGTRKVHDAWLSATRSLAAVARACKAHLRIEVATPDSAGPDSVPCLVWWPPLRFLPRQATRPRVIGQFSLQGDWIFWGFGGVQVDWNPGLERPAWGRELAFYFSRWVSPVRLY